MADVLSDEAKRPKTICRSILRSPVQAGQEDEEIVTEHHRAARIPLQIGNRQNDRIFPVHKIPYF